MDKTILITGSYGQLGQSLQKSLHGDDSLNPIFTDADTLDITDRGKLDRFLRENEVDVIVNCAAYTAVDKAEDDNVNASRLNTEAIGYIAEAAVNNKVKVLHISTDYVFSGESCRPYDENDEPDPHCIYGRTKLEGEGLLTGLCQDAIVIRTAWLYSEYGNNFVKTMLRLGRENKSLRVVADQIGTPTYAGDLAEVIHKILRSGDWKPGIYHFTNEGVASWYDFAKAIFRISGLSVDVTPVATREYPTRAKRPQYSVLNKSKIKQTYSITIPYWVNSLEKCLKSMK